MRWIVGDIHGCLRELERLLQEIRFEPGGDELWSVGDLVNRGPDSAEVLRLWWDIGGRSVLGNHDIKALLAHSRGTPPPAPLGALLAAPDVDALLSRLRACPVLVRLSSAGRGPDAWLVHAGLHPAWADLESVAWRVDRVEHDDHWLQSPEVRFASAVRCTTRAGELHEFTGPPADCPPNFRPWDELYRGQTLVVHGHWASRGHYRGRHTMGLDSGCVYGGELTAWCQDQDRVVQVPSRSDKT